MTYDFRAIEQRWQQRWAQEKTFKTPSPGEADFDASRPKFYVLDMFPYPSGVGLHVGHPLGYIATDIVARYRRMRGYNVLHPMGFDAFGLPAEQFAVEHGVHPAITTQRNIDNMVRQLKGLGLSYDWDRCISTTDVGYYRWTQWIFLQLYKSWFDPQSNRARPIGELEAMLADEQFFIDADLELVPAEPASLGEIQGEPIGTRKWIELDEREQAAVLDNHRLAFLDEINVNWCPALGTVLANEEVTNEGRSERGNHPVYKRPLKQWMLRITAYAQRLEDELDLVQWPEPIKLMQRNWIGRSTGARITFEVAGSDETIVVYTTRPDTLFGATYMVLAPEHPLLEALVTEPQTAAVNEYRAQAAARSDVDRIAQTKQKTGVFTGSYAINPANGEQIPIWIADYVLMGYGTGAIMAVPAHDQRDHDFATTFHLPIVQVITGGDVFDSAWEGDGELMASSNAEISLDGLRTEDAKLRMTRWLEEKGLGRPQVQYKLRDWLFSRQRYWGEPFPILHGPEGEVIALDESELPVELPPMEDFRPTASDDPDAPPQPPLSRAPQSWKHVVIDGKRYTRELNTMPQWAGSCWYYLRFLDPHNTEQMVSPEAEQYWMLSQRANGQAHAGGVDLYVGGAEHAVLHLLYARFWHKVLYDLGHVSTPEPFGRLFNQGYIQAYVYRDERGMAVPATEIEERPEPATITMDGETFQTHHFHQGKPVRREMGKMGKSLKNAVTPDEICETYGCDTMRLYEMYLGPLEQSKLWNTQDIVGVHRFLQRFWRNLVDEQTHQLRITEGDCPTDLRRLLHRTVKRVTDAMEAMTYNVAIAALIELNNELMSHKSVPREVAELMVLCLAPMAPHISEELWDRLGHKEGLAYAPWPVADPAMLVDDHVEYPVQVNGKVRGRVIVPAHADEAFIREAALQDEKVIASIEGKSIRKVIVVPKKMVNIVAG